MNGGNQCLSETFAGKICTHLIPVALTASIARAENEYRQRSKHVLATFETDRAEVSRLGIFGPSAQKKDAGPFLNPQVPWNGSTGTTTPALALPQALVAAVEGDGWVERGRAFDRSKLDFAWMSALSSFDHWSLSSAGPWKAKKPFDWLTAPLPDFALLIAWSKLRLLAALDDGTVPFGLADVRRLAQLLGTLEANRASVCAVQIATLDVDLPGYSSSQPSDTRRRAERYLSNFLWLSDLTQDPAVLDSLLLRGAPDFCTTVNEAGWRTYLRVPALSMEQRQRLSRLSTILDDETMPCRWQPLRQAWKERASKGRFVDHLANLDGTKEQRASATRAAIEEHVVPADTSPRDISALLYLGGVHAMTRALVAE